ncbi:MAG: HU family DNA-binding protein [Anaeroplasma sp.]
MNKTDIVAIVADKYDLSRRKAEEIVNLVFDSISEGLSNDDKVAISGFGNFEVRTRSARNGVNPRTGEEITIPAQSVPAFKPSKQLKDLVNKK